MTKFANKTKLIFYRTIVSALTLVTTVATAAEFYVAPNGSDANPGTLNQPFQTAKAARDAVRDYKAKRGLPEGGITIFFRAGVYEFAESLSLGERDSGTVNSRISYRAFPAEKVIFSGGKMLDQAKFKPVTDSAIRERLPAATAGQVVQYDLKQAGLDHYGDYHTQVPNGVKETPYEPALELYIGGKSMPVARYPNEGWIKIGKVLDPGAISKVDGFAKVLDTSNRGGTFEFDIPQARRWTKANNIWLSGWFFWGWFYDDVKVANLDVEKKQIKLASALRYGLASAYNDLSHGAGMAKTLEEARKYYVFNLLEEIDRPGEWYLDRATGILYVLPTGTFSREQIMVTALNAPIINCEKASYLGFEGLELVGGKQAGIVAKSANGVRIAGCIFRNLGGNAITLAGLNHEVVSCDIFQTKGGIIASGGSRRSLTPSGIVIRNCDIHHFTGRAIDLNGVGITVEHNEIHHAEGGAVGFSGNNHLIAYNSFNHLYNQGGDDLNIVGIGRNPSYQGSLIKFNLFSDIGLEPNNVNSVYLDDGSCGTTVYGNIFYRASTGDRGSTYSNGGSDNKIINNVFVDNPVAYWLGNCFHNWARKRIVDYLSPNGDFTVHLTKEVNIKDPIWVKAYPKLANYFEDDPATPKRNMFSRNVVINSKTVVRGDQQEINVQQVNERLEKDNFVAAAMPGLIDWQGKKFDAKKLSQVLKVIPEFETIPVAQIGNYKDAYRK
ncbi:MAG: right-handed parallel beta-helix repeat-containing protein [Verrucomicrobiota bacterium]